MSLQDKIVALYEGKVVRKSLTKEIKGNAVVPTYVLEYLLGQHCASFDEEIIQIGLEKVKTVISNNFVNRDEAEYIKSIIREKGKLKIIDRVEAKLNERQDRYEASFSNLGITNVPISNQFIKDHPKLLTGGVWCICTVGYHFTEGTKPWVLEGLKPIQISHVNIDEFIRLRKEFTTDEWKELLLQTLGLNPEQFGPRNQLIQLTRLIPFCERNYNLIELGPKGTGKSHVFSEFSPHGILISGGEVTAPKLFVNNASGKIGLVGFWDTVAFDEFAGKDKRINKSLVDIMKNYMANKTFSRGRESMGAEASFAFIGNTKRSVAYMMKHTNLFEQLPDAYCDTAFLDRMHYYIPGWEVDIIRGEMFTDGYGFIVDYFAEILHSLRSVDYSSQCFEMFELDDSITTRDRTSIQKTFGGLIKILYPDGDFSKEEAKEIMEFAIEGRRRVKLQLMKMDETFRERPVNFEYRENGKTHPVLTLEEIQYPTIIETEEREPVEVDKETVVDPSPTLEAKHIVIKENQRGISYKNLFADYLKGASEIHLHDPYLLKFYQIKNLHEFCQMILEIIPLGEEMTLKVFTKENYSEPEEQSKYFTTLETSYEGTALNVQIHYEDSPSFHARSIATDHGWKISLDRGLDIFQYYDFKNPFNLANTVQEERQCKQAEITYINTTN